jgi:hypothetical protein
MLTGDHRPAAASLRQALGIFRDIEDRAGQAHSINNLVQALVSSLPVAGAGDVHCW